MAQGLSLRRLIRSISYPVGERSSGGTLDRNRKILACGPQQALSSLKKAFDGEFKDETVSLVTSEIVCLAGMKSLWSRILVPMCNAFILMFYTDDEECFQAVSALKDVIVDAKGVAVPLIVVGYNRPTLSPRIMCPMTADCVVTIDWELTYTEATLGNANELVDIFEQLFGVIMRKHTSKNSEPCL